jgi:hypothetical protein
MAKIRIDASDVPQEVRKSGGRTHVPEGEYLVKITEGSVETTNDGTGRYIRWTASIVEPKQYRGKPLRGITSLKKEALWSLRNLIHAATGKNIAGKVVNFDPETLYGKVVGASVSDNEYTKDGNTRVSSQIDSFFPKDEVNFAEAEETEEEEEEEEVEEEDEELEDVDVDEL